MPVTIKDLAKEWNLTRQAIRARIARTKGFKNKYTTIKNHIRFISDTGVGVLAQRGKTNKHNPNSEGKRLFRLKIKSLERENQNLRDDNSRLYNLAMNTQKLNVQLNYYRNTNWLERLFSKKPVIEELPAKVNKNRR